MLVSPGSHTIRKVWAFTLLFTIYNTSGIDDVTRAFERIRPFYLILTASNIYQNNATGLNFKETVNL